MFYYNRLYQLASMGFAAFGVFLLAKRALQHFLERKRRHELQKRCVLTNHLFGFRRTCYSHLHSSVVCSLC